MNLTTTTTNTTNNSPIINPASASPLSPREIPGWFELDEHGQVLYSRVRRNNQFISGQPELVGKNFFEDVFSFDNIKDLQRRFTKFAKSREVAENFSFGCTNQDKTVKIRVMMLRAFDTGCCMGDEDSTHANIVILDIREDENFG